MNSDIGQGPEVSVRSTSVRWPSKQQGCSELFGIEGVLDRVERYVTASRFILLVGKRGAGKSTVAEAVAKRTSRPFATIMCSACDADEWLAKPELENGTLRRSAGKLTCLVQSPGLILLDEFHLLPEIAQSHLVGLTDHRRRVFSSRLDDAIEIPMHPECSLVAATNPRGLRRITADLLSRAFIVHVGRPSPEYFRGILAHHVPQARPEHLETTFRVFSAITESGLETDYEFTREMIKLAEALSLGIQIRQAVEDSLLNGLERSISERIKTVLDTHAVWGEQEFDEDVTQPVRVSPAARVKKKKGKSQ